MKGGFYSGKSLFLVSSLVAAMSLVYYLHIPLPHSMAHRDKMHIFEFIMRVVYYYPMKGFSVLGQTYQLHWTRYTLTMFAHLLGPWSLEDPELYILDTDMGGVPVRVYHPRGDRDSDGAVIFFHGGGFVLMDVATYEVVTREMARKLNMVVVSVDYRLAPEHLFPAGIEDCERAVIHFMKEGHKHFGVDPSKVTVMGDSAGGNLAAVVSRRLRHRDDIPTIKLQVLVYPVLQYVDLLTPSYQQYYRQYEGTSLLDPESIARWLMMYVGVDPSPRNMKAVLANNHTIMNVRDQHHFDYIRHDSLPSHFVADHVYTKPPSLYGDHQVFKELEPFLFNPDFSPLMAKDLSGLPKGLVITCQYDILRDEGYWYAKRMQKAGVDIEWKHYDTAFHAILNFHQEMEVAKTLLNDIVTYVKDNIDKEIV